VCRPQNRQGIRAACPTQRNHHFLYFLKKVGRPPRIGQLSDHGKDSDSLALAPQKPRRLKSTWGFAVTDFGASRRQTLGLRGDRLCFLFSAAPWGFAVTDFIFSFRLPPALRAQRYARGFLPSKTEMRCGVSWGSCRRAPTRERARFDALAPQPRPVRPADGRSTSRTMNSLNSRAISTRPFRRPRQGPKIMVSMIGVNQGSVASEVMKGKEA
jgi:hypothetical protein